MSLGPTAVRFYVIKILFSTKYGDGKINDPIGSVKEKFSISWCIMEAMIRSRNLQNKHIKKNLPDCLSYEDNV